MGLFEFILILVFMVVIIEAGTKLLLPLSRRAADLMGAMAEERRLAGKPAPRATLLDANLEEIEDRLARIEDRLGFLEELKAGDSHPALRGGPVPDRLGGHEGPER
jgi:hypothetical protein